MPRSVGTTPPQPPSPPTRSTVSRTRPGALATDRPAWRARTATALGTPSTADDALRPRTRPTTMPDHPPTRSRVVHRMPDGHACTPGAELQTRVIGPIDRRRRRRIRVRALGKSTRPRPTPPRATTSRPGVRARLRAIPTPRGPTGPQRVPSTSRTPLGRNVPGPPHRCRSPRRPHEQVAVGCRRHQRLAAHVAVLIQVAHLDDPRRFDPAVAKPPSRPTVHRRLALHRRRQPRMPAQDRQVGRPSRQRAYRDARPTGRDPPLGVGSDRIGRRRGEIRGGRLSARLQHRRLH